jgi:hypothetical protein
MKILKNKLLLTGLISLFILTINIAPGLAQSTGLISGKLTNVATAAGFSNTTPSIGLTVGTIIKGLLSLIGVIFMAYIFYGGYLWMTASGKEDQLEKAKAIIKNSIVGLIIVLGAYAITFFVTQAAYQSSGFQFN